MTTREWARCRLKWNDMKLNEIHMRPVFPGYIHVIMGCAELPTSRLSKVIVFTAWECMQLVRRGHFRCGHVIKIAATPFDPPTAIVKNFMLHANPMALIFYRITQLWAIEVYIAGMGTLDIFGSCDLDLDTMIFIYELDSYWPNAGRYTGCA